METICDPVWERKKGKNKTKGKVKRAYKTMFPKTIHEIMDEFFFKYNVNKWHIPNPGNFVHGWNLSQGHNFPYRDEMWSYH